MTQIKVVFLFTSIKNVSEEDRQRVREIVSEEYCRQFGCAAGAVAVTLTDGVSSSGASDLVLSIVSEEKRLNEGSMRSMFRKEVANRLMLLFPRSAGFRGRVTTMDGVFEAPETAASFPSASGRDREDPAGEYRRRAAAYQAVDPVCSYEMLCISPETEIQIRQAVARIQLEREVFEDWGLYAVMPHPISAMSFYGPPGTGKTMAADAVAHHLGRKIIHASYADIESKYHGEGPKNVSAIFLAAEQQNAVLFIDEADSLLSKRLTNVTQGSEQAINSMRSQLLICLESFHGVVIFATNLIVNYDRAFISRLINVSFPFPDSSLRTRIWKNHLRPVEGAKVMLKIPLSEDVNESALGESYELCGREIRNAVVSACVDARMKGRMQVDQACLRAAAQAELDRRAAVGAAGDHTVFRRDDAREALAGAIEKQAAGVNRLTRPA